METLQLNSADSINIFPYNTPSEFTVKIHPPLQLKGKWKVGIRAVSYSSNVLVSATVHFLDDEGNAWGCKEIKGGPGVGLSSSIELIHMPRRESTPVTTYNLSDILELCTDHVHPRQWARNHRRKHWALMDIPNIRVYKMFIKGRAISRVELFTDTGQQYLQRYYDHSTLSRQDLLDPAKSNECIYNAGTGLPRKPLPSDYVKEGDHTTFNFSDVGELTYDHITKQYTLRCKNNSEGVRGIAIAIGDNTIIAKAMADTHVLFDEPARAFHDLLAIHSDLVSPQLLGDKSTDLLAVVPRLATFWKDNYSHVLYKQVRYVPMCQSFLNKVRIQFKSIRDNSIQFSPDSEQTCITLEFKRWN